MVGSLGESHCPFLSLSSLSSPRVFDDDDIVLVPRSLAVGVVVVDVLTITTTSAVASLTRPLPNDRVFREEKGERGIDLIH
ncbi:hypothetical protein ml_518 [Mollivirus sibericum]|uniref:hypothetical protein n=1 Tax=Mollivirus sibericum TaxID=1678078 RepID=UPI0006B2E673|nr:hypothetical protein ml_6 [Mollivirus sibericum]YP_009165484.1 hypothetical protein ml_518 [Mollivirus sibericum]ALD61808.1 hypothetical protein ml_6 [Mollivirus sibericum]ALD62320.1 hypothetical protein ml_518 [Mollivirus sibericum]